MNDPSKTIDFINRELIPGMVERGELTIEGVSNPSEVHLEQVETSPLASDGTFMLTLPFRTKVTLSSGGKGDQRKHREYRLVVKVTPPVPPEMYASCQFDTLFDNETIAYTDIIPTLGKAELYPKYFYSHRKPLEAVMVLSDFSTDGWRMAPMVVNLPLEYCLLAARELGRFHGECYGLKETKRKQFESLVGKFKESRYSTATDPVWMEIMKIGPQRALKATRESIFGSRVPEEYLAKVGVLLQDTWAHQQLSVRPEEPLAVICHGDYLRNNMAFKFDDKEHPDKPTHVMMFDFQTLRYASPMIDFTAFIANSTGYDVREKHFEAIFRAYHDELVGTLGSIIGANPADLPQHYSYESFLKEFARYYSFGFQIASSFLPILHEPMEHVFANVEMGLEDSLADAWRRGGPRLDKELAAMVYEMYQLHQRFGMDPR